jgi:hypothetical protein
LLEILEASECPDFSLLRFRARGYKVRDKGSEYRHVAYGG